MWPAVILDEAHIIRTPSRHLARAAYALRGKFKLAMTGTPVQNHVSELWSLMHFVMPEMLGPYDIFKREVVRPLEKSTKAQELLKSRAAKESVKLTDSLNLAERYHQSIDVSADGLHVLRQLHKHVLPFILRRTKEDVAKDLPKKVIIDVPCYLSDQQKELYSSFQRGLSISDDILEKHLHKQLEGVPDGEVEAQTTLHPLKALSFLKLLCVHQLS